MTVDDNGFHYTISAPAVETGRNPKLYHYYKVELGHDSSILFKFYKNYLTVSVSGGAKDFSDSMGLLGQFTDGAMVDRHGRVVTNFEEFGFAWQVNPEDPHLFVESRSPQLPFEKCRMPTASRPARRKLRGANTAFFQEAVKACAHVSGSDFDLCTDDVLATGDVGIAGTW